ncbi:hypothetical protein [Paraburkholderia youngii]|uniref:hypothetical protein n=1 Tax=Paraburkholderia youngii TaxID=2782701 RepID=UPI003D1E93A5
MKAFPFCFNRKKVAGIVAVGVLAAAGYDLSHVYRGYQLLLKRAGDVPSAKARLDQVTQDMTLLSSCKAAKAGEHSETYTGCLTGILPSLQSGVGMYGGVALSAAWLTRHPDDKAVYTAASATMDRLWIHYRQVDRVSWQLADEAAETMNESVIYRAVVGVARGEFDESWRRHLKDAEVALNDPQLVQKQHARDIAIAMAPSQPSGPTSVK